MAKEVMEMKAILISGIETSSNKRINIVSDFGINNLSFYHYLKYKVCLPEENVFFYDGKDVLNLKTAGLLAKIEEIVSSKNPQEPLLIYYGGHGAVGEWSISTINRCGIKGFELKHKDLRLVLERQRGPLIIVADCCYAMSLRKELKKLKCEWLLLGLSPSDRFGYVSSVNGSVNGHKSVLLQIMESWLKRKPANPKYFNGHRLIRYFKRKKHRNSKYCLYMGGDKKLHKLYLYCYTKKIKINLREGANLDYLLFPKK